MIPRVRPEGMLSGKTGQPAIQKCGQARAGLFQATRCRVHARATLNHMLRQELLAEVASCFLRHCAGLAFSNACDRAQIMGAAQLPTSEQRLTIYCPL